MQAITPHRPTRSRPYAWGSIAVNPDPPRVGEVTRIEFPLANPGPDEVVVERIETKVALFGIGVHWEHLASIGPFHLLPDARRIEYATVDWKPRVGGHRCVRASIYVQDMEQASEVGRNLQVIHASEEEEFWRVPFRLGNPERVTAPILLRFGGNEAPALDVSVRVGERIVPLDRPIWLRGGEDVHAELLLRAQTDAELHHVRTIEATINGRFIDGIQVTVRRPARGLRALVDGMVAESAQLHLPAYSFVR